MRVSWSDTERREERQTFVGRVPMSKRVSRKRTALPLAAMVDERVLVRRSSLARAESSYSGRTSGIKSAFSVSPLSRSQISLN